MYKWAGILIAIAAIVIAGAIFLPWGYSPPLIFNFDDGTLQGWSMGKGVSDDAGNEYTNPAGTIWGVQWYDSHQYPGNFPGSDPKGDKNGCYAFINSGLDLKKIGFPLASKYWQVDVVSSYLTSHFKGTKTVEAYLGDMFSTHPFKIEADILLKVYSGGTTQLIPSKNATFTTISKTAWTKVTADFALPTDAVIQHIVIRVRGDHPGLFEGAVFIDHVGATKE